MQSEPFIIQEMSIFWERCLHIIRSAYPTRCGYPNEIIFALFWGHKKRIFFDLDKDHISFNEEFASDVINDQPWPLELVHAGIHELFHAVSFKKVENKGQWKEYSIGLERMKVVNGRIKHKNRWLNEYLTDWFSFAAIENAITSKEEFSILWREIPYVRLIQGLITVIGMEVVEAAYFEGKLDHLKSVLAGKGVRPKQFFQTLEEKSEKKQRQALKMLPKTI